MEERAKDIATAFCAHVQKMAGMRGGFEDEGVRDLSVPLLSFSWLVMYSGSTNVACLCSREHRSYLFVLPQQVESILGSIYVYRVHDYVEQIAVVASLEKFLEEHPKVKVVMLLFVPQNVSFLSSNEQGVPGRAKPAGRLQSVHDAGMAPGARRVESESHR